MRKFFPLALLIGAVLGLFGHGVVLAMSPNCAAASVQSANVQTATNMPMSGQMDCCPHAATGKNGSKPAKDTMPNCQMMAGSFVSLAIGDAPAVPTMIPSKAANADWPLVAQLASRATAPELPPPTI